ncbi:hypothetical protein HK104_011250, partial [Borealophlyctis nickersoniae]
MSSDEEESQSASEAGEQDSHSDALEQGQAASETQDSEPNWQKVELKVRTKLFHIRKELRKTVKKGKTFETQKLVKKVRFARTKVEKKDDAPEEIKATRQKELQKLEADTELIKNVNIDAIVHHLVLTTLPKTTLPGCDRLLDIFKEMDAKEQHQKQPREPLSRMEVRVAGSKAVRQGVMEELEELRGAVTGQRVPKKKQTKKKKKEVPKGGKNGVAKGEGTGERVAAVNTKKRKRGSDDDDSAPDTKLENSDFDSDISDAEYPSPPSTFLPSLAVDGDISDISVSSYGSGAEFTPDSEEEDDMAPPKQKRKPQRPADTDARHGPVSTFVTSLGGDVSDISVSDYDYGDPGDGGGRGGSTGKKKKKVKNRVGQRARREQWEKLYGTKAKHLVEDQKKRR